MLLVRDQFEQVTNRAMSFDGMPQGKISVNTVVISATDPLPLDVAAFLKVLDDPLDRPLCDTDLHGDFPQYNL